MFFFFFLPWKKGKNKKKKKKKNTNKQNKRQFAPVFVDWFSLEISGSKSYLPQFQEAWDCREMAAAKSPFQVSFITLPFACLSQFKNEPPFEISRYKIVCSLLFLH